MQTTQKGIRFLDELNKTNELKETHITPFDSQIETLQKELEDIAARREIYRWLIFNEVSCSYAKNIVSYKLYDSIFKSLEFSQEEKEDFQRLLNDHKDHLILF